MTDKCRHPTLIFHSGGYYVQCKDCKVMWVAIKNGMTSDQDIDHSRGGDNLYAHDERSEKKA
jgi:hypothetical protein